MTAEKLTAPERPAPDGPAVRLPSLAEDWAVVPPASCREVVKVLYRAGFEARLDGPDHIIIERAHIPLVRVPLVERLRPALLVAILRTVGLTAAEFTANLGELGGDCE
jgi:hypothetical protein